MKKVLLLIIAIFLGLLSYAQENNGTVYSKHPAIDKTKKFWAAFEKGDKVAFSAFLADTMVAYGNGNTTPIKRENFLKMMDWWFAEFANLKVVDDTPAFPDAIDYKTGGLWVQDWLKITGVHKKSGINLDLNIHNLYQFNKADKIAMMFSYYDNSQLEAIDASMTTKENGKIYITHPLIITVRKGVNAYCAEDLATLTSGYSPNATFGNSTMKWGQSIDLAKRKKELEKQFAETDNIKMKQIGYPDCIYYEKGDSYVVYSWWIWSGISKATGKKTEFPMMLAHTFDKDGKIVDEYVYYSTNHFESTQK
jgi:ketosteroid isomerase-like protein